MTARKPGRFLRFAGAVWRGVDLASRLVLALLVIAVVVALAMLLRGQPPEVPDGAALVVAPSGVLVEELSGDPTDRALDELTGQAVAETLWRDLDDAIRAAAGDDRIRVLVLDLDGMVGGGLEKLQALGAAIDEFKQSEKPVIASADFYGRDAYYLASAADEIYLNPEGAAVLDGYGRYRTYYKEGIDRLEIDWNVFRVGEYKSAVEPFLRNDMSPEARQANREWLGDLWSSWTADVSAARGMTLAELGAVIDGFVMRVAEADGDLAQAALAARLVDHLASRDQVRDRLIELVGEDEETHSFHQVGHRAYLAALGDDRRRRPVEGNGVAVVIAKGTILDGSQPPGAIGGDSTAALVRDARHDDANKAIVLRVDSGGGSAFASEVIRRELELAREAGKKVVVSMGTVAASGGYWISTASDEIWASPTTITGSIGIFGMLPTFQKPMQKYLGWRVDGVGTNWLAGALRVDRALDPGLAEMIQLMIEDGYRDFLERVAEARDSTPEQIDQIARGRVWSGANALELGLVDHLGGLDEAVASAARLAELGENYAVRYVQRQPGFGERLLRNLLSRAGGRLAPELRPARRGHAAPVRDSLLELLRREAETLAALNDPSGVYALCFCAVE